MENTHNKNLARVALLAAHAAKRSFDCSSIVDGCYGFIPSSEVMIESTLTAIEYVHEELKKKPGFQSHSKPNVLDLGCGVSPLLMALGYGLGVEHNPRTVSHAGLYHGVIEGDLLNMSKAVIKQIKKADFIYMYKPIFDDDMYCKAVTEIWSLMKPGAYIVDTLGPIHKVVPENTKVSEEWLRDALGLDAYAINYYNLCVKPLK